MCEPDPTFDAPYALHPIGRIASDYPDKFGIPRQPGLAAEAHAVLHLLPPYDDPLAVRGLERVSHLWLTFVFHRSPERWTPLVRPPRLGGNARLGVFATRSTHRPNRLGLSLVELAGIETRGGVRLHLRGHDLVDGTPVLDIKPYLPWAEARPEAEAGFAPAPPPQRPVHFTSDAEACLNARNDGDSLRRLIIQVLAQDPRPAYRRGAETRHYGVALRDVDVRFQAVESDGELAFLVGEIVALATPRD
ncbi:MULTISPECIES: tRNA (N6-threonylcarbamoyladenosine(37)-N6)-methyltransferase TrmO [unclassified Modicisalibacter]|uniref:tRNA (N6-threonylcarbamoyladenosine(37)-N6)-methyltransferase TrmO n=1 Tax=unclassified Modicisalibacter TaxID=2679913 RepID=UPI001CCEDCAA|nr:MULTISPECIES: tRNA (N6-threonylcarbamoyladenosine(37)-N6)-methyltransferase TrmO [unclassified Modicisalibacter]MBZ9557814.1 tRNA (N6-threonylcarbamoyladenosine(37)-N6)-methyltransferase TrmO [Modicisalibacter sp. R2A 31.J]MBZ9573520.1 tRNA (N6-threonylcarbamoyladenosine(37)-N6)-methyltransferase TrmO [Modicisalibacter sp. MOD 31.J]